VGDKKAKVVKGCWDKKERLMGALNRAVSTDLHGLAENPCIESCERDIL
jgi:hypothetical protein